MEKGGSRENKTKTAMQGILESEITQAWLFRLAVIHQMGGIESHRLRCIPGARSSLPVVSFMKCFNVSNLRSNSRLSWACPFWIQCFNIVRYIRDTLYQAGRANRTIQCFTLAAGPSICPTMAKSSNLLYRKHFHLTTKGLKKEVTAFCRYRAVL